ncbi:MAG: hypothetical protein Q9193_002091 [Seirophora villosa]
MESDMQHAFLAGAAAAHQRLTKLLMDYGSVKTIHPAVTSLRQRSQADGRMLEQAMSGDYLTLLSRSSRLESFEINIFEAAFVRLMEDVKTHPGAIQIYVEELLGLKAITQPLKGRALSGAAKVRTMFLNLAINDGERPPSPTCNSPPPLFPQNESGLQLLSNLQSRAEYAPIRVPDLGARSGYEHNLQLRNTFNHAEQHMVPHTMRENNLPSIDNILGATSTTEMDDPRLTSLLAEYYRHKHTFTMATASSAAYVVLANQLRDSAQKCIQYMSQVKPGDARLGELCEALEETTAVVERTMHG